MTYNQIQSLSSVDKSLYLEANFPVEPWYNQTSRFRPVCGVGKNDATYHSVAVVDGKRITDKAYAAWSSMLRRCYSDVFKSQKNNRSYHGATVHEEWHSFMAFRSWWLKNYREGYWLDKDLLCDGDQYGPDSSLYVPTWVNNLTTDSRSIKSGLPIGCYRSGGRYSSSTNINRQSVFLGMFDSPEEAHNTWLLAKISIVVSKRDELLALHPLLPVRVIDLLYNL